MSDIKGKYTEALAKLAALTQENRIIWELDTDFEDSRDDIIRETAFRSIHKGKNLRIYRQRFKTFLGEAARLMAQMQSVSGSVPEERWVTEVVLEIISPEGASLWRFPTLPVLKDLFLAVTYQAAKVGDFLDDILNEE
jgi:hypothetical protein